MSISGIVQYMKERSTSDWKPPPEATVVLTKDNFTEVTEREDLMVVMFYAPWLVNDFHMCEIPVTLAVKQIVVVPVAGAKGGLAGGKLFYHFLNNAVLVLSAKLNSNY
jgi:hypothetical protein